MSKNKKVTRYLHLHRIPFILLWMSTYAMGWGVGFLVVLILALINSMAYGFLDLSEPAIATIIGLSVGAATALGQPWLARQRSGMVLRFWRPLTIVGYGIASLALAPILSFYTESSAEMLLAHFVWFSIPAILPMLSLRRIVRGAWKWIAAAVGVAAVTAISHFVFMTPYNGVNAWQPYSMLFGTIVQSFVTALIMTRLLKQPHSDTQLSADASAANQIEAATEETSRGYLHQSAYMLLWVMTQGVGWMFIGIAILALMFLTQFFPAINTLLNGASPIVMFTGFALIYGIFTAWGQPWLIRLRTGRIVDNWRPLTIIATTLAALVSSSILESQTTYFATQQATLAIVGIWFITPSLLQMLSLRKVGRNIWLWPLSGIVSAAIGLMILNQTADLTNTVGEAMPSMLLYAIGFGHIVQAILSGLVSLQILEAPSTDETGAEGESATTIAANLSDEGDQRLLPDALPEVDAELSKRRLQANH
jgi:hypothetical protein